MDGIEALLVVFLILLICDIILCYIAEILQLLLILSILDEDIS